MQHPLDWWRERRWVRRYRRTIGKPFTPDEMARMRQWGEDTLECAEVMKAEKGHHWREGAMLPGYSPWPRQGNWWH